MNKKEVIKILPESGKKSTRSDIKRSQIVVVSQKKKNAMLNKWQLLLCGTTTI
jgi:hypothetical protein